MFYDDTGTPYANNVGARILGLLNGVKHNVETFSRLHSISASHLQRVIDGHEGPSADLRSALERHSPINISDIYPVQYKNKFKPKSNLQSDVSIRSFENSMSTRREFQRGPYAVFYTYADLAVSYRSSIRPERIKQHFYELGEEPELLPDWAFNSGHHESQLTMFIGDVNFHWRDCSGKKHVRQMKHGDLNFISPFVPHSFSARKEFSEIIAVTYQGETFSSDFMSKIEKMSDAEYLRFIEKEIKHQNIDLSGFENECGVLFASETKNLQLPDFLGVNFSVKNLESTKFNFSEERENWCYVIDSRDLVLSSNKEYNEIHSGDSFLVPTGCTAELSGKGEFLHFCRSENEHKKDFSCELKMIHKFASESSLFRIKNETLRWY